MQRDIIVVLLILNIIAVIVLIIRMSRQKETPTATLKVHKDIDKIIAEESRKLKTDINVLSQKVDDLTDTLHREMEQRRQEIQSMNFIAQSEAEQEKEVNTLLLNERYREIFELYSNGYTAEEIAKKLDKGYGEVLLILQLADQARP